MAELLDPEGVWDDALVALMLPVALEIEADDAEAQFGAVGAAVSGIFGKEAPEAFLKGIQNVRHQVRQTQYAARGQEMPKAEEARKGARPAVKETSNEDPAEKFLTIFKGLGMKAKRGPHKRKPGKRKGR